MDTKRFLIGTAVGAATVSAIGFSLFALPPLRDFYLYAMNAGSATGVARESPLVWAVFVGALSYGALITLAIGNRASRVGVAAGNADRCRCRVSALVHRELHVLRDQ